MLTDETFSSVHELRAYLRAWIELPGEIHEHLTYAEHPDPPADTADHLGQLAMCVPAARYVDAHIEASWNRFVMAIWARAGVELPVPPEMVRPTSTMPCPPAPRPTSEVEDHTGSHTVLVMLYGWLYLIQDWATAVDQIVLEFGTEETVELFIDISNIGRVLPELWQRLREHTVCAGERAVDGLIRGVRYVSFSDGFHADGYPCAGPRCCPRPLPPEPDELF